MLMWRVSLAACLTALLISPAAGQDPPAAQADVEIAASLPLTGSEASFGVGTLEGVQLAIEEANATGAGPHLKLVTYDDASDDAKAREIAGKVVASPAVLVLGPGLSTSSLAAGPVYEAGHMASLTTAASSDLITRNRTTFRTAVKNSDQGEFLAAYVSQVLNASSATVIWVDNGFGQSLHDAFGRAASRFGLSVDYFSYKTPDEIDSLLAHAQQMPEYQPTVLLTLDADGAQLVAGLRRRGVAGPILGGSPIGTEDFSTHLANTPEEAARAGALTDGVMGLSPMILDSANANVLAFAGRFHARFGHDPLWFSTLGYDAALAGAAAVRAGITTAGAGRDRLRQAVIDYLIHLNEPDRALPGVLGPILFDKDRGVPRGIRIGRFNARRFESAPVQLVPTTTPDAAELSARTVFEISPGRFVRRQRVVYTGVFLNEVSRIDLPQSRFTADFYLWLRYADNESGADPAEIDFPNLVRGSSEGKMLAAQAKLDDGTTYRLWRLRGDFKNDFDLHRYPLDRQTLTIPFFNAKGSSERVVYVRDRRSQPGAGTPALASRFEGVAADDAFRDLTQWSVTNASSRRESLVTDSALGDPRVTALNRTRELSGFTVTVEVRRRVVATLIKTLLPLLLMAMIMYATLHFPPVLIKEKVTVAVTAALTGTVLLGSINAQLGTVGYVMDVEYVFYIFFALCLFAIVSALAGERLRMLGRVGPATKVENAGQFLFILAFAGVAAVTAVALW
jgi:ABC-type branched-subunit amino acid transport system substrate-binding protein